jgi:hypothetical protein
MESRLRYSEASFFAELPAAVAEVLTATGSYAAFNGGFASPPVAQPAPNGVTETALIPKSWTVHNWSFPRYFPGWEKERKHEGIEVLGRPEGVYLEAGR